MARSKKVGVLDVSDTISKMFIEYGQQVNDVIDSAMEEVARESMEDLKAVNKFSPNGNPTGEYSKDWTYEIQPVKRYSRKFVVFNEDHYRLTHLLESGHAKYLWGRPTGEKIKGYEHIKPVNDKAQEHLEKAIERRIENL